MLGLLIAVPIPDEYQADGQVIEVAIQEALVEAGRRNIRGKDVTPFVLSQVNQLTMGASLTSSKQQQQTTKKDTSISFHSSGLVM